MNRFATIDAVTAEAKSILKTATEQDRLLFRQWVWTALKEIGPGKDNIDVCRLYAHDYSFKKPDDMLSAIDIALYQANGTEVPYRYKAGKSRIHVKKATLNEIGGLRNNMSANKVDLSEDDYYFHISSDSSGEVSYADVRYFKLPVDDDNLPQIPEDQVHAITMFIRYMWMMRERIGNPDVTLGDLDMARRDWWRERDRAKSRNKMPSMLEGTQIATEWMTMIAKPKFKNF